MSKTRYVSTITLYTYGDTPDEALQEGQMICAEINNKYDSRASVEKLHLQPFGTMQSKEININNLKHYEPEF
jgi:hypothetical protein